MQKGTLVFGDYGLKKERKVRSVRKVSFDKDAWKKERKTPRDSDDFEEGLFPSQIDVKGTIDRQEFLKILGKKKGDIPDPKGNKNSKSLKDILKKVETTTKRLETEDELPQSTGFTPLEEPRKEVNKSWLIGVPVSACVVICVLLVGHHLIKNSHSFDYIPTNVVETRYVSDELSKVTRKLPGSVPLSYNSEYMVTYEDENGKSKTVKLLDSFSKVVLGETDGLSYSDADTGLPEDKQGIFYVKDCPYEIVYKYE